MSLPGVHNLTIYKGDDFSQTVRLATDGVYINLTGWSGRAQLRSLTDTLITAFNITFGNQTTAPGELTMSLTAAVTSALTATEGVYDLELTTPAPAKVKTYLAGSVTIVSDVTK